METTKQCKSCNIIKPITDYYWAIDRPNPRSSCKECERIKIREYYKNNPDKQLLKNEKYRYKIYTENKEEIDKKRNAREEIYLANKKKKEEARERAIYKKENRLPIKEYQKQWQENNKESQKAKAKEWYDNRDGATIKALAKKQREYYEANKERMNAMSKAYNKEYRYTENGRLVRLACGNRRRVRKRMQGDGTIPQTITHPLASELQELLDRQDHKCNNCGTHISREKKNIELDHHFPISKDGQDSICNVVWLCKQCNRSKSAKMPDTLMMVW